MKEANYGQIYTPPSLNGTVQFPGTRGGGEWGGPAFDPESGIMYVNANEVPMFIRLKRLGVSKDQALSGAQLYQLNNCSMCHGPDRTGVGAFPSLLEISRSPEEVISLLGTGKGQMPAFSNLTEEQKKNLTDYLFNPAADKEEEPTLGDLRYVHDGWNILADQDGYFGVKPPWGTLNAIDLNEGKILWKVPLGEYPELIEKGLLPSQIAERFVNDNQNKLISLANKFDDNNEDALDQFMKLSESELHVMKYFLKLIQLKKFK